MRHQRVLTTFTDDAGLVHDVRNGGAITRCDQEIPVDWKAAIVEGWPTQHKRDHYTKPVTCLECIVMEDS